VNPTKVLCQIECLLFVIVVVVLTILAPISGKAVADDPEITVLDIRPNSMPLNSDTPSVIRAVIQSNAQTTSTLHIFVEEYPSGSGCGGSQHETNGSADFTVGGGPLTRGFNVPWFGHELSQGFLRIGARLDNGDPSWSNDCLRFGG
jgi:hypothetical protein